MKIEIEVDPEAIARKILKESAETCAGLGYSEELRMLVAAHNYFAVSKDHIFVSDLEEAAK